MQHGRQELSSGEVLQQRPVDVLHMLLEYVIEVADGLVQMEAKRESDGKHGYPTTSEREPPSAAATAGNTLGKS